MAKRLENKALHQGAYLREVSINGVVYSTNGHLLSRGELEVKPLKSQTEGERVELEDNFLNRIRDDAVARVHQVEEWTNNAGLELVRATNGDTQVSVQALYLDYINDKYDVKDWYMTEKVVFAVDDEGICAVISRAEAGTAPEPIVRKSKAIKGEA